MNGNGRMNVGVTGSMVSLSSLRSLDQLHRIASIIHFAFFLFSKDFTFLKTSVLRWLDWPLWPDYWDRIRAAAVKANADSHWAILARQAVLLITSLLPS